MATPEISSRSSELSAVSMPRLRDDSNTAAYERYLLLPELSKLWASRDFPNWKDEPVLKPALQALETTFRLVSIALSDPRPYANRREWERRLDSLAARQIELIAALCEADHPGGGAPVCSLSSSDGVLAPNRSSQEVWKLPGASPVVSRTSEASLLPRLATWDKSEDLAAKILSHIECEMRRCPFTLGLGEPNLAGKPNLEYDLVVRPAELHSIKMRSLDSDSKKSQENQALFTVHHVLESWLCAAGQLVRRIGTAIDGGEWVPAAGDCWALERLWKLLSEVEDLLLLADPEDFLRLKGQLGIRAASGSEAFCFRSAALRDVTSASRDLARRVPRVLGVEVDPSGGPRVQEAAMRLFHHGRQRGGAEEEKAARIHLLQAMQAVEAAVKRFYFAYRQLVMATMGSVEASSNRAFGSPMEPLDALSQMFLEPTYFPSLDAAKTFLGEYWRAELRRGGGRGAGGRCRTRQ